MSQPSAWIRSCAVTFGKRSGLAHSGVTLLVSSHVMEEADHCDELLLMRDGDLLATDTPAGLRQRTGRQQLDEAFLALIEDSGHR